MGQRWWEEKREREFRESVLSASCIAIIEVVLHTLLS